jgi:uncharacterized protein YjbJ (UPF0337 family)
MTNPDDIKGRIKEAAGSLTDDQHLKNEGKADRMAGKAKDVADKAERKIDDAVDNVRDHLRH